ncbi:unnamed protein product [Wickerhamomyces anomalus]
MVSILRLNYQRVLHQIATLMPLRQLKNIFIGSILIILALQIYLLNKSSFTGTYKLGGSNEIVIVDKTTPVSSHYKYILDKYSESFPALPFNKKCELYFDELYKLNHDWEVVDVQKDTNKDYNKDAFNHDQFMRNKIQEYKKNNEDKEPSDGKKAEFELDFQKMVEVTLGAEQNMIDAVTHLRVFGKCYLNDNGVSSSVLSNWFSEKEAKKQDEEKIDMCYDIEQRLFPWLSRELPVFKRWSGESIIGIPKMSKYIDEIYEDVDLPYSVKNGEEASDDQTTDKDTGTKVDKFNARLLSKRYARSNCFLNTWRSMLNGKGIVLSAADKYESDLVGLLRVLRALNNKLPIQIVHKGDLSEKVQDNLVKVARADDVQVPKYLYDQIKDFTPQNFPKQEIWFVNAKKMYQK